MPKPTASLWAKMLARPAVRAVQPKPGLIQSWDQRLERFSESLEPKPATDQTVLANTLKQILAASIEKISSKEPVDSHFQDLLTGLHTLTDVDSPIRSILSAPDQKKTAYINENCKTEAELITCLNELYHYRRLSPGVAVTILRSPLITSVRPFLKICNDLNRWAPNIKQAFALRIAVRSRQLGDVDTARKLVVDCFDTTWTSFLVSSTFSSKIVFILGRELFALNGESQLCQQIEQWNQETFTADPTKRVILPLIGAAFHTKTAGAASTLGHLIDAGLRCIESQTGLEFIFLSLLKAINDSGRLFIDIQTPGLLKCTKLLQSPDTIALTMNSLLDLSGELPSDMAKTLLASLDEFARRNYTSDRTELDAAIIDRLAEFRAFI